MQIKRFEAKDMTEALKMIKKEFGSQAVILSAKTLKKSGGLFGSVRKTGVEITAASDRYSSIELKEKTSTKKEEIYLSKSANASFAEEEYINSIDEFSKNRVNDQTQFTNHLRNRFESPLIKELSLSLRKQGLADFLIRQIIEKISISVEHHQNVNIKEIKDIFYQIIDEKVVIAKQSKIEESKSNIVAFVGPTGVGKTTTIAKLSAINTLEKKYPVVLISLDNQRIGATTALEKYAGIIGLPYKTVQSEKELSQIVNTFQKNHLIFVDTPGIAITDKERIDQLAKQLASISPNEVHLLISAATKDEDMVNLCNAYAPCHINRLIFTKIDETYGHGNLLNLIENKKIPLAYLTNGQQVPEHIIEGQSEFIADLLLFSASAQHLSDKRIRTLKSVDASKSILLQTGDYYIANKNSDIFHHRKCKSVGRINMNNVIVFENKSDAQKQNFKPCRMCCYEKTGNQKLLQKFNQNVAISQMG